MKAIFGFSAYKPPSPSPTGLPESRRFRHLIGTWYANIYAQLRIWPFSSFAINNSVYKTCFEDFWLLWNFKIRVLSLLMITNHWIKSMHGGVKITPHFQASDIPASSRPWFHRCFRPSKMETLCLGSHGQWYPSLYQRQLGTRSWIHGFKNLNSWTESLLQN